MRAGLAGAVAMAGLAGAADFHWRFARVTLAEGKVTIEHARTGERHAAKRNQPVGQGFWMESRDGRIELELEEGTQIRLGPASVAELSDLTPLDRPTRDSDLAPKRRPLRNRRAAGDEFAGDRRSRTGSEFSRRFARPG